MKPIGKVLVVTFVVVVIAVAVYFFRPFSGMSSSGGKIGVTMSAFDDKFLTVLRNGMQKHVSTLKGVDLQVVDAKGDVSVQITQVKKFIDEKVDAIIVNAVDTNATPRISYLATQAGIPLVYVNRMPSDKALPAKIAYVGSNEVDSGTLEMKEVCKLLGGKGSILVMMGDLSNQAAKQRTQDVEDVIATPECKGISILAKRTARWQRDEAKNLMGNWIEMRMKFDAVVANNDEMALGAIAALKAANVFDAKTIVAGVDATQDALESMKAGELKVTVFQNAAGQGKGAVDTALKMVSGEKVPSNVWVPFELVTPANLNEYLSKN